MYDIFLSYSSQDRERLMPLVDALEQQGWSVFWDHRAIPVGRDWHEMIGEAIQECRCVLVAWSVHSIKSPWVKEEALAGKERKILFPILLDKVALPFGFKVLQSANFSQWDQRTDHPEFLKLNKGIRRALSKQPAPPSDTPQPLAETPRPTPGRLWTAGITVTTTIIASILGLNYFMPDPTPVSPPLPTTPQPVQVAINALPKRLAFEPDMVAVKGSTFTMGCENGRDETEGGCFADEKPIREVTIADFKASSHEITVEQYLHCVKAKACDQPHWQDTKTFAFYAKLGETITGNNQPIVGVSWDNAQQYTRWLSGETGTSYRLLTEAEWEYAARAGTATAFPWGNAIVDGLANCRQDLCRDSFPNAAPVGSFAANPFGLHDMQGNVWEWVQDSTDDGSQHRLRGGSWANRPQALRSAMRHQHLTKHRHYLVGFRVAAD